MISVVTRPKYWDVVPIVILGTGYQAVDQRTGADRERPHYNLSDPIDVLLVNLSLVLGTA